MQATADSVRLRSVLHTCRQPWKPLATARASIGTLVERTTRYTMLLHLPRMQGYGIGPRVKNGPALAGYGAEAVRDAIASTITTYPGSYADR